MGSWAMTYWVLWFPTGIALVFAFVYFLLGQADKRREREVEIWRRSWGPPPAPPSRAAEGYRGKKTKGAVEPTSGARRVAAVPADLAALLAEAGGGRPIGIYELVPRTAYLAVCAADPMSGSDHQTVIAKLAEPGAELVARPLPIVDGARVANTGVAFKKDPEFAGVYLVEGVEAGAIKKWLSPPVREQLCELPDLWLRVHARAMALTLYGTAEAERIDELVAAADVIFAEYGAEGGLSLLGDDLGDEDDPDEAPAPPPPKQQKKAPAQAKSHKA